MSQKRDIDEVEEAVEAGSAPKVKKLESNGGKAKAAKVSDDENGVESEAEDDDKSDTEKDDDLPALPVDIPEKEKGVSGLLCLCAACCSMRVVGARRLRLASPGKPAGVIPVICFLARQHSALWMGGTSIKSQTSFKRRPFDAR